ncbi:hypothetical protein KY362_08215 [Candidatus Woesearchaeota archaeon]|nr:hypothetical protein [Candidatus Woesearchaeota archaeon]
MEISHHLLRKMAHNAHHWMHDYKDGDPDVVVDSRGVEVKMQNGWFNGVLMIAMRAYRQLQKAKKHGDVLTPLDEEFMRRYEEFSEYAQHLGTGKQRLRDVKKGNEMLEFWIEYAQQKLHKAAA